MNDMILPPLSNLGVQPAPARQARVLLISGSITKNSRTHCLVDSVAEALHGLAAQCSVWHLAHRPMPLATCENGMAGQSEEQRAVAQEFRAAVSAAEAIVLATPVYHGSYSGTLKNALDHLGKGAFAGKVVGLLSHGSKAMTCGQPIEHLRPVAANLQAHVLSTQLSTCDADFLHRSDERTTIESGELTDRIRRLASELIHLCQALELAAYLQVPTLDRKQPAQDAQVYSHTKGFTS
ncbi:NADPH-dependent FMN reductase [Sinorhizobium meliloti]|uniref:NADPH-dependent FMN reductase n=1 Tax=Rhizobium meliloti TaxID=382 RepID=UPI00067EB843|nr:NADPH-dependent FMN reductase [Sinorhizobium meliloti]